MTPLRRQRIVTRHVPIYFQSLSIFTDIVIENAKMINYWKILRKIYEPKTCHGDLSNPYFSSHPFWNSYMKPKTKAVLTWSDHWSSSYSSSSWLSSCFLENPYEFFSRWTAFITRHNEFFRHSTFDVNISYYLSNFERTHAIDKSWFNMWWTSTF